MGEISDHLVFDNMGIDEISSFLDKHPYINKVYGEPLSSIVDEFDFEIYEISKQESDEIWAKILSFMETINENELATEAFSEVKRYIHTFKGNMRMVGLNRIGLIAHRIETLLNYIEDKNIKIFEVKKFLDRELSKIQFLTEYHLKNLTSDDLSWLDSVADLEKNSSIVGNNGLTEDINLSIQDTQQKNSIREQKQLIRVGAEDIDGMINEASDLRLVKSALEGFFKTNKKELVDLKNSSSKLIEMVKEIQLQAETQIQAKKDIVGDDNGFDPLEFDRFTRLQELTRFMNEAVADVQDNIGSMESLLKLQENSIAQQAILTNSLHANLMKTRLLPMESISDRLYKITRNTAKELQKSVSLELIGGKTEMDRLVLEKITSPLEHILRNCIAHGIENQKDRSANNKPPVGQIKIDTFADGNFIIIKIQDDGAGISIEKVKNIGVKKGLIKEDEAISDEDVVKLIFKSGFSTASVVSQVAGRGVGMDVVKNAVANLGGYVDIKTQAGRGTEFSITLPVAVATSQAMLVSIMDKLFAIPISLVDEVTSIKQDKIKDIYHGEAVFFKDKPIDFIYGGHLMGLLPSNRLPETKVYNNAIKINDKNKTIFLHVDKIIATTEVLIKAVGPIYGKMDGILGATLMGDGTQGLLINPIMLSEYFFGNREQIVGDGKITVPDECEQKKATFTVMIIDDSITVRRATAKVLEKYGYGIVMAKDGSHGLEQLQVIVPDIILLDIEMPKMNGFEFAKNIKGLEKYKKIPIIMITSRTADKHRKLAFELGVEGFLGKPYKEDELMENVLRLINKPR